MNSIFASARNQPEQHLVETEQHIIDFNHHEAGVWLAYKWHLPEDLINVIEHHQNKLYSDQHKEYVHLIGLCSRISRSWLLNIEHDQAKEETALKLLKINNDDLEKVLTRCHKKFDDVCKLAASMG